MERAHDRMPNHDLRDRSGRCTRLTQGAEMDQHMRAAFSAMHWDSSAPGVREKRVVSGSVVLRLVEFSPPFAEDGWCEKGHAGYVVSGGFTLEMRSGCSTDFVAGDGLAIPDGAAGAHRAMVDRPVVLFLIESAGPLTDG